MKNKILITSLILLSLITTVNSQSFNIDSLLNRSRIGLKVGVNFPSLSYTNPNLQDYRSSIMGRGALGVYLETELNQNLSIRPELLFIGKGQKIDNLGISYKVNSNYFEVRLPVLYTYKQWQSVSPYAIFGPALSFATGGKISFNDLSVNISKANMSPVDFGFVAGLGVKVPLNIQNVPLVITGEIAYNQGLINTYGEYEKNGTAVSLNRNPYTIVGTRLNNGVEFSVSLAIPLRKIKTLIPPKKKQEPVANNPKPTELPITKVYKNDCYEIEEVLSFLNSGVDVNDKKICMYNLGFEFNKSTIDKSSIAYLNQIIQLLKKFPSISMKIIGHADSIGTEDNNLIVSKERAFVVYNYLIKKGIKLASLSYKYYGSSIPISTNSTEEGRKLNRRVEFVMKNGFIKLDASLQKDVKPEIKPDTTTILNNSKSETLPTSYNAEQYYKEASDRLNTSDLKGAILFYTDAIKINSKYVEAYNDRGVAYIRIMKYSKAIKDFKMALKINPEFDLAQKNKQIALSLQNERTMRILNAITIGLNAVSGSINTLNNANVPATSSPQNKIINTPQSNKTNGHIEKVTCSYCKGTRVSSYPSQGTCFGIESFHWCKDCNKSVPCEHGPHLSCIPCQGKGYTEKFVL